MTDKHIDDHPYSSSSTVAPRRKWQSKPVPHLIKGAADHAPEKKVILGKLKEVVSQSVQLIQQALTQPIVGSHSESDQVSDGASDTSQQSAPEQPAQNTDHYIKMAKQEASKEMDVLLQEKRELFDKAIAQERQSLLAELEDEKKRGYEEAFKKGFKDGREEGVESLKVRSEELTTAINDIFKEKNALMIKSREQLLHLSLEIAKQVIQTDVSLQPAVSMNIVEEALKRVTDKDHVVLRLNPLEANWIRSNKEWLETKMKDIGQLVIQDDDNLEMGGCIIETKLGFIDASLKTKLRNIEASFLKLFQDQAENKQKEAAQEQEATEEAPIPTEEEAVIATTTTEDPFAAEVTPADPAVVEESPIEDPFAQSESAPQETTGATEVSEPSFDFDDDFDDDDFDFDDLDLD